MSRADLVAAIGELVPLENGHFVSELLDDRLIMMDLPAHGVARAVVQGAFGKDRASKSCRGFYQSSPPVTAKRQVLEQRNCATCTYSLPRQSKYQRLELFGAEFDLRVTMDARPPSASEMITVSSAARLAEACKGTHVSRVAGD